MNLVTDLIVCGVLQVTLVAATGLMLSSLCSRWTRNSADRISLWAVTLILLLTMLSALPIPSWLEQTQADYAAANPVFLEHRNSTLPDMAATERREPDVLESFDIREFIVAGFGSLGGELEDEIESAEVSADTAIQNREIGSGQHHRSRSTLATWIFVTVCLAFGIGLVRLVGGLWSVQCLVKSSRPVNSGSLCELTELLCAELRCVRRVSIRECAQLNTAATVGFRHPVILVSSQWRTWKEEQLRCVLAHEISHIVRGDFAATVVAQFGLLLHFYHPLLHWLVQQLRLHQEIAADALASSVAGGPQKYMKAIGELALLQSRDHVSWPAHSFLPTRTTFLRRIEMLRDVRRLTEKTLPLIRGISLCSLLAVTCFAAGLRRPESMIAMTAAGEPNGPEVRTVAAAPKEDEPIHTKYVPADASGFLAIRPAAFMPMLDQLLQELKSQQSANAESSSMELNFLKLMTAVRQVTVVVGPLESKTEELAVLLEFNEKAARDEAAELLSGGRTFTKESLFLAQFEVSGNEARYFPDDHSLILGETQTVARMILAGPEPASPITLSDEWKSATKSSVALAVKTPTLRKLLQDQPSNPISGMLSPFWMQADQHIASLRYSGDSALKLHSKSIDEESSATLEATEKAALSMLRGLVINMESNAPASQKASIALLSKLLKSATITRDGREVVVTIGSDQETSSQLFRNLVIPAIYKSREAAARASQSNNMKQIMLALHNYASAHGRFPPAVIVDPATGIARSWRVEILPYLAQGPLYNEYRKDEPWDSETNLKVLSKIPSFYRHPGQPSTSTFTSIFAAYGHGLCMTPGDKDGLSFSSITDGASNTIMIVEAAREIPWTKPDEILIDLSSDSMPQLGGLSPGGWHAGFADGHVSFMSDTFDDASLRKLLTIAGGEPL